jgi:hypothetical protein
MPFPVAARSVTATPPYDDSPQGTGGTGWGVASSFGDHQNGEDKAYADCSFGYLYAWAEVRAFDEDYDGEHMWKVTVDVDLTAYATTGWFGQAWVIIYILVAESSQSYYYKVFEKRVDPDDPPYSWSSYNMVKYHTFLYTYALYFGVRLEVVAKNGATVCLSSSQTSTKALLEVNSISWLSVDI